MTKAVAVRFFGGPLNGTDRVIEKAGEFRIVRNLGSKPDGSPWVEEGIYDVPALTEYEQHNIHTPKKNATWRGWQ